MTGQTPATHTITAADFQALATGSENDRGVAALRRSERSWRLLAIRSVMDIARTHPEAASPLPSVDVAWQLLIRAHLVDPDATEDVLAQPQVGVWAAHTLRRLVHHSATATDAGRLWKDLGYLHTLAAAAAVRAGLSFELDVPARYGLAVLPTVGAASLPPRCHRARVVARDGAVTMTDDIGQRTSPGDRHWHHPIRLTAAAGGVTLRIEVVDRDVYRNLRGTAAPAPLDDDQVRRWEALLRRAWYLLVREQPARARSIAATLRTIAPLPAGQRFRPLSASGTEAFGGVLLSEPDDAVQLAATLVHESQHHKLGALTHLLTLVRADPNRRFYAPWRDDPRPIGGLLQGSYAFAGVTEFWRIRRLHAVAGDADLAAFEFALWRRQTRYALRELLESSQLTDHGRRFVEMLHRTVCDSQKEPVSTGPRILGDRMAIDHYALWRAHNLRIGAAGPALAAAWASGDSFPTWILDEPTAQPMALPDSGPAWFDTRAVLVRHRLTDAAAFDQLCAESDVIGTRVTGATAADLALVSGDDAQARTGYLRQLAGDSPGGKTLAHSCIGLGLTWSDDPTHPAARALLHRPELVMETLRHTTRGDTAPGVPDLVGLAAWVGDGLARAQTSRSGWAGWPVQDRASR